MAESNAATIELSRWIACFASVTGMMSDQGPQFTALLIKILTVCAHVRHHFTTACSPLANEIIERPGKERIRAMRSILSEWRFSKWEQPVVVGEVRFIMSQLSFERLGRKNIESGES